MASTWAVVVTLHGQVGCQLCDVYVLAEICKNERNDSEKKEHAA